jgi:hypothetical protein
VRVSTLIVLLVCGPTGSVRADSAPPAERAVELVIAGMVEDAAAIAEVVGELLRRFELTLRTARVAALDVAAVVTPDPEAEAAVGRVWIDLAAPPTEHGAPQAAIYVADGSWERIRIRRILLPGCVDEVAREEVAHMVASDIEAILSGRPLERSREEARSELGLEVGEPTPEPSPLPEPLPIGPPGVAPREPTPLPLEPERPSLALELGLGWELTGFADQAAVSHGPTLAFGMAFPQSRLRPAMWLTMGYRLPLEIAASPFGARLDQGVFRLLMSIDVPLVPRLQLTVLLGGGIDVVWTTPRLAEGATGRAELPSVAYVGILRAGLGLRVNLGGSFALLATVGCDVDGQHRTYVALLDGTKRIVLEPWPVRPLALLTFSFDLLDPLHTPATAAE